MDGGLRSRENGLFLSDSVTREIYSHSAVILGWPRAILMQLAHPLVAAGVGQHSSYQIEPLERFVHTFDSALQIIFGTKIEVQAAADRINAIHERVRGELAEAVGGWPSGTPYRAGDPDLLLWVHCTLVDSDVVAFEKFVRPLSRGQKEALYEERAAGAQLFGLARERMPKGFTEMQEYLSSELASDRIAVGAFQRKLAGALLYPAIKRVPKKSYEPMVALTADMMPETLRSAYGLELTPLRKTASRLLAVALRRALPLMPNRVKAYPAARAKNVLKAA